MAGIDEMSRFLAEGIVMKDFKHSHVMGLIGVCFPEEEPPFIVLPFMANGDLHSYLKKTGASVSSLDDVDVTVRENNYAFRWSWLMIFSDSLHYTAEIYRADCKWYGISFVAEIRSPRLGHAQLHVRQKKSVLARLMSPCVCV